MTIKYELCSAAQLMFVSYSFSLYLFHQYCCYIDAYPYKCCQNDISKYLI